ncbi:hypothetical protein WMY93_001678 [Mugilogobius chulae]|uniref:Uncharacterized protein n=1 Tax=Mugilogobius chulae TaxID=88201 RepID=A0AAW0Q2B3_9GOBI
MSPTEPYQQTVSSMFPTEHSVTLCKCPPVPWSCPVLLLIVQHGGLFWYDSAILCPNVSTAVGKRMNRRITCGNSEMSWPTTKTRRSANNPRDKLTRTHSENTMHQFKMGNFTACIIIIIIITSLR